MIDAEGARRLAREYLAGELPRRWTHVQAVAARAVELGGAVAEDWEVLVSAAWLHDIGYAPGLVDTGFHPLDGARFLRRRGPRQGVSAHQLGRAARRLLQRCDERSVGS